MCVGGVSHSYEFIHIGVGSFLQYKTGIPLQKNILYKGFSGGVDWRY